MMSTGSTMVRRTLKAKLDRATAEPPAAAATARNDAAASSTAPISNRNRRSRYLPDERREESAREKSGKNCEQVDARCTGDA